MVGDGVSASQRALATSFDLIVLDVMLPRKDGFEVCRELRRAGLLTPIILLTVKTQESDRRIIMAAALDPKELVEFRELVIANTIQVDTMYQLLIQKGYFTESEFLAKMKEVQKDYQRKGI